MQRSVWIAAVGCLLWNAVEPAAAVELEAYGRLPLYENAVISPDGTRVAFVTTLGEERTIIIQNFDKPSDITKVRAGNQKLRGLLWAGPNHLLVEKSQSTDYLAGDQGETAALESYDLGRKQAFAPMMWIPNSWNLLRRSPVVRTVDGRTVLFLQSFSHARMTDRYAVPALYRVDLDRQTNTLVEASAENDPQNHQIEWFIDTSGKPIVQTDYDEKARRWSLQIWRDGKWAQAQAEQVDIDAPFIRGLAPEGNNLLMARYQGDKLVTQALSLTDGSWGAEWPMEKTGSSYIADPMTRRLIGAVQLDAQRRYLFFSKEDQAQWDQIVQSFPGEEVQLESWTDDRKKIIVRVFGEKTGAGFVLINLATKQMSYAGNLYAGIGPAEVSAVRSIHYPASDGLSINAYVTLPKGKPLKALPLVVLPHGGPASRDYLEFDWWAQALASRGYVVLQPNFRGSWGYGYQFERTGYGEWGRKMQTDLSDGVRVLVKQGVVDPTRVCIVGASYGGYAALAGAALDKDVYRCAVSVSGISDLKKFGEWINAGREVKNNRTFRYLARYLGVKDFQDTAIDSISPASRAADVGVPVLLIHGDNDAVVPLAQSQYMADALKKAGKPFEFIKLKGEDHWLSRSETRTQMLQAVVKFLETHNPSD